MERRSDAERAAKELDQQKMAGERVDVRHAKIKGVNDRRQSNQGYNQGNNYFREQRQRYRPG